MITDEQLMKMSEPERAFLTYWHRHAPSKYLRSLDPVPEHEFYPSRDWCFDFAWPDLMVAVEIQGGTWAEGRHVRGQGYRGDCEKHNRAIAAGWDLFWFTPEMLDDDPEFCALQIASVM